MKIIEKPNIISPGMLVAGIGFFDGVHLGHQALIGNIVQTARERNMSSAVVTFRCHPRQVLHNNYCPHLINSFEEWMQHLSETELDYCIVLDFTQDMSMLSARQFISFLAEDYGISCLYVGYDHRFGHNRLEGFSDYVRYGKELGVDIIRAQAYHPGGKHVSSSVVRTLLSQGKVEEAASLLTYSYCLEGEMIEGHKLGRELGFPTANLTFTDNNKIIPANGVYAVRVQLPNGSLKNGMLNIGTRPTVSNGSDRSIEVNLFDFSGNLYGCVLKVFLIAFLREEERFSNIEKLIAKIQKDKEHTLRILLSQ